MNRGTAFQIYFVLVALTAIGIMVAVISVAWHFIGKFW